MNFDSQKLSSLKTAIQTEKLLPTEISEGVPDYVFGISIAIDGNRAVVGSGNSRVYVYEYDGKNWNNTQIITSPSNSNDNFGFSLDISETRVLIGANLDDERFMDSGAAYIYEFEEGIWLQKAKLIASDAQSNEHFASSVSLSGDRVLIGVPGGKTTGIKSGSAYVFDLSGEVWEQSAILFADDGEVGDNFGNSVGLSGDMALVGSPYNRNNGERTGSVYGFTLSDNWSQISKLVAGDGNEGDKFGEALSLDGARVLIGARFDADIRPRSGSAYIFEYSEMIWSQTAKLVPGDGSDAYFGFSVSLLGEQALIGGIRESQQGDGSAYIFEMISGQWLQTSKLIPVDNQPFDAFGYSVAQFDDVMMISSIQGVFSDGSGAVYVYRNNPELINMQAGHSGLWYYPRQNGHGINLFMLSNNRIVVTWYVYDNGKPIWLLGEGVHDGYKAILEVNTVEGGLFPPNFNSNDVNNKDWGQFELEFYNCRQGLFKWEPIEGNGFDSGNLVINRLSSMLGLSCIDDSAKVSKPIIPNKENATIKPVHSGLWYNFDQSGHGISVNILENNRIVLLWYVFDNNGDQTWLIGEGTYDGMIATLDVNIANGASFPPNFYSTNVNLTSWGKFILEFSGCNNGIFKWDPLPDNGFSAGEMTITRLTTFEDLGCND